VKDKEEFNKKIDRIAELFMKIIYSFIIFGGITLLLYKLLTIKM